MALLRFMRQRYVLQLYFVNVAWSLAGGITLCIRIIAVDMVSIMRDLTHDHHLTSSSQLY